MTPDNQTAKLSDEADDLCNAIAAVQLAIEGMEGTEERPALTWLINRVAEAGETVLIRARQMHGEDV